MGNHATLLMNCSRFDLSFLLCVRELKATDNKSHVSPVVV